MDTILTNRKVRHTSKTLSLLSRLNEANKAIKRFEKEKQNITKTDLFKNPSEKQLRLRLQAIITIIEKLNLEKGHYEKKMKKFIQSN